MNGIDLVSTIKKSKAVLIVGHVRPDGDCFGSGLSVLAICKKLGVLADFVVDSELPQHYSFMDGFDMVNVKSCDGYDLVISVDCADELRMGRYYSVMQRCHNSINIDHHITNTCFAKVNIVKDVSSTCELLYYLIKDSGIIDDYIATNLFIGLSTDTGHFMHNNTTSDSLIMASELVRYNFNCFEILNKLYKNNTVRHTKLASESVSRMRYFKDNRIAIITITMDMLNDCGCTMADTEGIIDHAMAVGCVEVAVCMTQQAKHSYKVSFRSKKTNVAEAARVFGGGGHALASGCVVNGYYEDCVDKLIKAITDGMND